MSVTKDTVSVEAVLKGEGRERKCRVNTLRHTTYEGECPTPVCVSYSRCEIEDADDFPDGNYEVEFDGRRVAVTKKAGQYSVRCV
jgi:hypothetical protein